MIFDARASALLPRHHRQSRSRARDEGLPSFEDPFAALKRAIIDDTLCDPFADPFAELERSIDRSVFLSPLLPEPAPSHPDNPDMTSENDFVSSDIFESDPEDIPISEEGRKKRLPNLYPYLRVWKCL